MRGYIHPSDNRWGWASTHGPVLIESVEENVYNNVGQGKAKFRITPEKVLGAVGNP
jgi:hypothetical protein